MGSYFNEPAEIIGGWGGGIQSRADEVKTLVDVAVDCGHEKNKALFAALARIVYSGKVGEDILIEWMHSDTRQCAGNCQCKKEETE